MLYYSKETTCSDRTGVRTRQNENILCTNIILVQSFLYNNSNLLAALVPMSLNKNSTTPIYYITQKLTYPRLNYEKSKIFKNLSVIKMK